MMNNLIFDLSKTQPVGSIKIHGGGKYGEAVFRRIVERGIMPIVIYDSNKWLNPDVRNLIKEKGITLYDLNEKSIDEIVQKDKIKVIYSPLADHFYVKYNKCDVIATIHGLRDFEMRADWEMTKYKPFSNSFTFLKYLFFSKLLKKKQSLYYGDMYNNPYFHFVTVSNHTKYSLLSNFPFFAHRDISVFYSPSTSINFTPESTKYIEKYYLLVSANRYYKNNLRVIKAFDRLFAMGLLKNVRIKITGISDYSAYRYNVKFPEMFDLLGFVDEKDLAQLYHDAYCFIYPSITEGFGYPPLEAMRFNTPIIASPLTSISEVCGDGALYFNPYSIEEIMSRIMMMEEPEIYKNLVSDVAKRYNYITTRQNQDLDKLVDYILSFCSND